MEEGDPEHQAGLDNTPENDSEWMPQPGVPELWEANDLVARLHQEEEDKFHANWDDPAPPPDTWWRRIKRFFVPLSGTEAKVKPDIDHELQ